MSGFTVLNNNHHHNNNNLNEDNQTSNSTQWWSQDEDEDATASQTLWANNVVRIALISAIVCTSLFGNVAVLMVFHRKPQLLHVANRFVFNLLLADLLQTVLVMPLVLAESLAPGDTWPLFLGSGLCQALVVLMHLFAFAGVNTIVVVSIDRYLAIIHPLSYPTRMTPRRGSNLIILTWLLGVLQSTPPLFGWGQIGFDSHHHLCSLFWSASHSYTVVTALLTFWLPVVIMLGCYWMVFRAARRQNALVHPTHHQPHHHHHLSANTPTASDETNNGSVSSSGFRARPRRFHYHCKAARVVFVIMSSYMLSMGPYSILSIVTLRSPTPPPLWLTTCSLVLFFFQCCVHPYIYGYMHRSVRREFLSLLCGSCCAQRQPRNSVLDSYYTVTDGRVLHSHFSTASSRMCPLKSWEEGATCCTLSSTDNVKSRPSKGCHKETLSTSCSSERELHLLPTSTLIKE